MIEQIRQVDAHGVLRAVAIEADQFPLKVYIMQQQVFLAFVMSIKVLRPTLALSMMS